MSSGKCYNCHYRPPKPKKEPVPCSVCGRKMRARNVTVAEAPDTVKVGTFKDKLCWTCLQKQQREARKSEQIDFLAMPQVQEWEYRAVKKLIDGDEELMKMLGLDMFERSLL